MPHTLEQGRLRKRQVRAERKAAGLCTSCGKCQPKEGRAKCQACMDREVKYVQTYVTKWPQARFDEMWRLQGGLCAICKKQMTPHGKTADSAVRDHDHTKNTPRGLLCDRCNRLLGVLEKGAEFVGACFAYIERWR